MPSIKIISPLSNSNATKTPKTRIKASSKECKPKVVKLTISKKQPKLKLLPLRPKPNSKSKTKTNPKTKVQVSRPTSNPKTRSLTRVNTISEALGGTNGIAALKFKEGVFLLTFGQLDSSVSRKSYKIGKAIVGVPFKPENFNIEKIIKQTKLELTNQLSSHTTTTTTNNFLPVSSNSTSGAINYIAWKLANCLYQEAVRVPLLVIGVDDLGKHIFQIDAEAGLDNCVSELSMLGVMGLKHEEVSKIVTEKTNDVQQPLSMKVAQKLFIAAINRMNLRSCANCEVEFITTYSNGLVTKTADYFGLKNRLYGLSQNVSS
ncbi:unnamed protein product [Ambrosiozyma monospora]|uniref:Unnamed protein product n=1 Tax=Ambrosiozyma monospora TaxID=43982 RepID=A0A9W6YXZ7_AMBMO|nr:unnamed protein product [Ambrosiozyma monospora]